MRKLILTFFLIVLILILIKNKKENFYNDGCVVANLSKPVENDFYQCFLGDIESYNTTLSRSTHTRRRVVQELGKRIRNYFVSLYLHGLEKDFRLIVAFVPSSFREGTQQVHVPRQNIFFRDFMEQGYNTGNYRLKPNNFDTVRKLNINVPSVRQINGLILGMGFKMSISTRLDNKTGINAPITRQDPTKVEVVIVSQVIFVYLTSIYQEDFTMIIDI